MIIDFHAHLDRDPVTKVYDVDGLLRDMEENHIDMRVVSTFYGASMSAANDKITELVRQYPDKIIGCAVINPKLDDAVEEAARVAKMPEIRMIEFNSLEHGYRPEKFAYNIDPILEICREHGLIVKVFTGQGFYTMPEQWVFYSHRFPEVTFVIEHMGGTDYTYGTVELLKEEGIGTLMLETSYESEVPALNKVFRNLPDDLFLYGSNYPANFTKLSIMKFDSLGLSEELKEKMFYKNAAKLLKLDVPEVKDGNE